MVKKEWQRIIQRKRRGQIRDNEEIEKGVKMEKRQRSERRKTSKNNTSRRKESKKGTAIRKFIFWKSNKEKLSDYPSYLCYYLDYSEGRSDPIKRKLYPFEDEKLGLNHFKNLVSENIKKGWEKHGA